MFKKLINKISKLETIEEKSFWVIAPSVALMGLAGLGTGDFYASAWPTIISAILCLIIPVLLMIFVHKKHNYHSAYPMLCIFVGAISIPLTFVFSGGFFSGMPIFCTVTTGISALCYESKWRYTSLLLCVLGNTFAFYYVYHYGSPYPLIGTTTIYNDIIFSYIFTAVGLFLAISLIIVEIGKYKLSQDVLQQYFDIQVRKEILSKSLDGNFNGNEKKKAAIIFADISSFTTITEKMKPEVISEFLNEFFSIANKHIHESNGIIDKYIGDCIMAYWFDQKDSNCVLNAVKAVTGIKKELYIKSEEIYKKYNNELNFSCGISYGEVIFGDIGSETMHNYTIIGDAVNTASRIQDFAASGEVLLSDSAAKMVAGDVELEKVETDIYFKGKNKSVNLYRIIRFVLDKNSTHVLSSDAYGYSLYVCGCRGSFPVSGLRFSEYGGETSCYVLKKDDYAVVIDCGTGLKNATELLKDCKKVDILLTHVHYDHILGLLMATLPKEAQTRILGYFSAWSKSKNTLSNFMEHPYWPIEIKHTENISIELEKEILLDKDITATFYKSDHPDDACVIKLMCKDKNVCIFADCEDANKLDSSISMNADLLFFDGMFDDGDTVDHKGWGHGTWQDGVRFCKKQNIKKLIITHHSPEIGDHSLLQREMSAADLCKNVSFAKTGDRIII